MINMFVCNFRCSKEGTFLSSYIACVKFKSNCIYIWFDYMYGYVYTLYVMGIWMGSYKEYRAINNG